MQTIMQSTTALAVALAMFACGGCASIMHGTTQDVGISSNPSGAEATLDGVPAGRTPVIAPMKRGANHILKLELPGYSSYEVTFTKGVSGWVWGNVLFGGLIGLAVDAISGGLYNLTPEQLTAEMRNQQPTNVSMKGDQIHILVVMQPRPEWKLVAQLDRQ